MLPVSLKTVLPTALCAQVERVLAHEKRGARPAEIRMRLGRVASLTFFEDGHLGDYPLAFTADHTHMAATLGRACGGSVYACEESLKEGFVCLGEGIRVGVAGKAVVRNGRPTALSAVESLVFRLPPPRPVPCPAMTACFQSGRGGILLFSPPGGGKTTALRGLVTALSQTLRVAVVDTRGELCAGLEPRGLLLDLLCGYPRGAGISIAARTLSAELIVCDEIGDLGEAQEIAAAHAAGVPLLASAHAADVRDLLARPGLRLLHEARCFGYYVGVTRREDVFDFYYDVHTREAADAFY